jgi:hypothetical protein
MLFLKIVLVRFRNTLAQAGAVVNSSAVETSFGISGNFALDFDVRQNIILARIG